MSRPDSFTNAMRGLLDPEAAAIEAYVASLEASQARLLEFIRTAPASSGICCCGDNMNGHADPMECGHSPCDDWDWAVECLLRDFEVST